MTPKDAKDVKTEKNILQYYFVTCLNEKIKCTLIYLLKLLQTVVLFETCKLYAMTPKDAKHVKAEKNILQYYFESDLF
jgi:hypothetical protein